MIKDQHERGRRDGQFSLASLTDVEKELPFHLVGAGCDFYQYKVTRPFGYPVYQWIQTESGTGILELEGAKYRVPEGSGFILYPEDAHVYYSEEGDWYNHWITFNGHHIESMLKHIGLNKSGVYSLSEHMSVAALIRKAVSSLASPGEMTGLNGSVIAYELLIDLFKYVRSDDNESRHASYKRLIPVFKYIDQNLDKPFGIDGLAAEIGITPQYFCEIFKQVTKQRPTEYINRCRIERAKELMIRYPSRKIHIIAGDVGFESNSYFSTVFKKQEGLSPAQFREFNSRT